MIQKVILMGFVGNDPETRYTQSGRSVTTFRLGCHGKLKGEKVTSWYTIQCWENSFKHIMSYIKKGSALLVTGELSPPHIFESKHGPKVGLSVTASSIDFAAQHDAVDPQSVNQEEMPF